MEKIPSSRLIVEADAYTDVEYMEVMLRSRGVDASVKQISSAGIIIMPLAVKFEVTFRNKDGQTEQIHSALYQWYLAGWSIYWQ